MPINPEDVAWDATPQQGGIDPSMVTWDSQTPQGGIDPSMVRWDDEKPQLPEGRPTPLQQVREQEKERNRMTLANMSRMVGQGAALGFGEELGSGMAALAGKVGGDDRPLGEIYKDILQSERGEIAGFREAHPVASTALEIAGSIPTTIAAAPLTGAQKLAQGVSLGKKVAEGARLGGLYGGLYGAGTAKEGERLEGLAEGTAAGVAAGSVLPVAGQAVGRVLSPKAASNPQLQKLQAEGVRPTVGQALGGAADVVEQKLSSVPFFGDMIKRARNMSQQDFQRAAWNRALEPIGKKLSSKVELGRDAVNHVEKVLKGKYDEVLGKIGAVPVDDTFRQSTDELTGLVKSMKIPEGEFKKFDYLLNKVNSAIDENGYMTSEGFKKAESALTQALGKLRKSADVYDDDFAMAATQLRENLRELLRRHAGDSADDLAKVNQGWANFKVLQRASGGVGTDAGEFTAAQLQSAVKALDKSKDKGAFARGGALMQDLSEPGKAMLSNTVPNSGTVDRALLAAGVGGAINPTLGAAMLGGSAAYTRPVQNALVAGLTRRPEIARKAARGLNALGTTGTPAAIGAENLVERLK